MFSMYLCGSKIEIAKVELGNNTKICNFLIIK
jgi:hypothetical protein